MSAFPPLETLGTRICICGPSNAGKSTLANAIGKRLGIPTIHLDQLHHTPNTNWVPRPRDEFVALHAVAIAGEHWAMDGNYSALFPARFARATGIILLGDSRWANLRRYFIRTLFQKHRAGVVEGAPERINWKMIHWIVWASPPRLQHYRTDLPAYGLPMVQIDNMAELQKLYTAWGLER
jgi:adenylate kinase family enzyme